MREWTASTIYRMFTWDCTFKKRRYRETKQNAPYIIFGFSTLFLSLSLYPIVCAGSFVCYLLALFRFAYKFYNWSKLTCSSFFSRLSHENFFHFINVHNTSFFPDKLWKWLFLVYFFYFGFSRLKFYFFVYFQK